ncbi:hypothetical protein S40293_05685 [Stachybotrys chartarum IBT 40293]|nr:hypothetical protein S40293_05685 [Stachybotrys chartarum IBT 40293]
MPEALAGLSIAANVAQFVALGIGAAIFLKDVYDSGHGLIQEHQELQRIATSIKQSFATLERDATSAVTSSLQPLLKDAVTMSRGMDLEFSKLQELALQRNFLGKSKLLFRAARKRKRIEDLHIRLIRMRDQVTAQLVSMTYLSHTTLEGSLESFDARLVASNVEFTDKMKSLELQLRNLNAIQRVDSGAGLARQFERITGDITAMVSKLRHLKQAECILRSLHFKQISERKSEIKVAHQRTFEWSLSEGEESLASWLRHGNGIYWIQGKAGSGKSTLMKFLERTPRTQELLEEWAGNQRLLVASHYFWAPGSDLQRNISGLFRALLFQILIEHPILVSEICPDRMDSTSLRHLGSWTLEDLNLCFQRLAALEALPVRLCFFIDGLDEFRGDTEELIQFLQSLKNSRYIKLCVSSRPWIEFQKAFADMPQLRVEDFTKADITAYVDDNLRANLHFAELENTMPEQARYLRNEITSRADGVFLWVYLVTRNLLRGFTNADDIPTLIRRLEKFPRDLEGYFMSMLDSIESVYHAETSAVFSMIAYSPSYPLALETLWAYRYFETCLESLRRRIRTRQYICHSEFLGALDKRPRKIGMHARRISSFNSQFEKDWLTARCKDLVHVWNANDDPSEHKVGFLHRSVADFMALPRISQILKRRTTPGFLPRVALCMANILLLRRQLISYTVQNSGSIEAAQHLVYQVFYLILQAQKDTHLSWTMLTFYLYHVTESHGIVVSLTPSPLTDIHLPIPMVVLIGQLVGVWPSSKWMNSGMFIKALGQPQKFAEEFQDEEVMDDPATLINGCLHKESRLRLLDTGHAILERLDYINLQRVEMFLSRDLSKRIRGNDEMDPWGRFLLREGYARDRNEAISTNFLAVCKLLIFNGAPRFIQILHHYQDFRKILDILCADDAIVGWDREIDGPRRSHTHTVDSARVMASLIATQNTKTSLEEIEKLWADAPDQKHPLSLFDWVRQSFGLLKT